MAPSYRLKSIRAMTPSYRLKSIRDMGPSYFKDQSVPIISYSYTAHYIINCKQSLKIPTG